MKEKNIGTSFESWLDEEGIAEEGFSSGYPAGDIAAESGLFVPAMSFL